MTVLHCLAPRGKARGALEKNLLAPDETALKGSAAFRPLGFVVGMAHTKGRRHFSRARGPCHMTSMSGQIRAHHSGSSLLGF